MNAQKAIYFLLMVMFAIALAGCANQPFPVSGTNEVPLYKQLVLTSVVYEESGTGPEYNLRTNTPVLIGLDDSRVTAFNQLMVEIIALEVELFKQNMAGLPMEPIASGSFLEVDFEQTSPDQNFLSLIIHVTTYSDGAAHEGTYSHSITFDLDGGSPVPLAQLFIAGSEYLQLISDYCISELLTRDIAFDPISNPGASPTIGNYKNWNLTADGLLITFDPYQVAAYAAGPQLVTIPYEYLRSIYNPNGPLMSFMP